MTQPNLAAYLALADKLGANLANEAALLATPHNLPPLTEHLLGQLFAVAQAMQYTRPKRAWAICRVAQAASLPHDRSSLQAMAIWQTAYMSMNWVQPQRVIEAIEQARTFSDLMEPGWSALCTWVLNAHPWTRNDFAQAEADLTIALTGLKGTPYAIWMPHCRLSLAFIQTTRSQSAKALANLEQCERDFATIQDNENRGRCLLLRANHARRQSGFPEAERILKEALTCFDEESSLISLAQTQYQFGLGQIMQGENYKHARANLLQASEAFARLDMPLWSGQCQSVLGYLYRTTGRIAEAREAIRQAKIAYAPFPVHGVKADHAVENGKLAQYRGQFFTAIEAFTEAKSHYEALKMPLMVGVTYMYIGESYARLGRHQSALQQLERAFEQLAAQEDENRLAECHLRLAEAWLQLARPGTALTHLQQAIPHFEAIKQPVFLNETHALEAESFFRQNDSADKAIELVESHLTPKVKSPQQARLQNLLGVLYLYNKQLDEAQTHLQKAERAFLRMGMMGLLLTCRISLGDVYVALGQAQAGKDIWDSVVADNSYNLLEVTWRVQSRLAGLAVQNGDEEKALNHYTEMAQAITRLRQQLWQPALADSYLNEPSQALFEAVQLAHQTDNSLTTLQFIEMGKTKMTAHFTKGTTRRLEPSTELLDVVGQMRSLEARIEESRAEFAGWLRPPAERVLVKQLIELRHIYDTVAGREERAQLGHTVITKQNPTSFALTPFRNFLNQQLDGNWLALDYYFQDDQLFIVFITPKKQCVLHRPMTPHRQKVLEFCTRAKPDKQHLTDQALAELGKWLIPKKVLKRLSPDTYLVIAPHSVLHRLPWSALQPRPGPPLVTLCTPLLTPSLSLLIELTQRPTPLTNQQDGLVLGVSAFDGRHSLLPAIHKEVAFLRQYLVRQDNVLLNETATWAKLQDKFKQAPFAFWHVATHAFYDSVTGRASGLALRDKDIWLDALWELAPLPPLVVFSACSGLQSRLHTGDEQVGLAMTCLLAGANQVVGSLWPVDDTRVVPLIEQFYTHIFNGHTTAQAVAILQRHAIQNNLPLTLWGGFACIGSP